MQISLVAVLGIVVHAVELERHLRIEPVVEVVLPLETLLLVVDISSTRNNLRRQNLILEHWAVVG